MKSRGELGREVREPSLTSPPPPSLLFFRAPFFWHRSPLSERLEQATFHLPSKFGALHPWKLLWMVLSFKISRENITATKFFYSRGSTVGTRGFNLQSNRSTCSKSRRCAVLPKKKVPGRGVGGTRSIFGYRWFTEGLRLWTCLGQKKS